MSNRISAGGEAVSDDADVASSSWLLASAELHDSLPLTETLVRMLQNARKTVGDIVAGRDPGLLVVVGLCSIHDLRSARSHVKRLHLTAKDVVDRLLIVMCVFF